MKFKNPLRGSYEKVNTTFIRERAGGQEVPRKKFYAAILTCETFEDYYRAAGDDDVFPDTYKTGPVNADMEIKYALKNHRTQESTLAGNPGAGRTQSAACDQRMNMQMTRQGLRPGVQHQREGQAFAKLTVVRTKLSQRGCCRTEQHFGDQSRLLARRRVQGMRNGKHEVIVRYREQVLLALRYPLFLLRI